MNKTQRDEIREIGGHTEDPILHLSAVAEILGRSPQTIGRWVTEGCLPSVVMPNRMRKVRKSQLVEWMRVTGFKSDQEIWERYSNVS